MCARIIRQLCALALFVVALHYVLLKLPYRCQEAEDGAGLLRNAANATEYSPKRKLLRTGGTLPEDSSSSYDLEINNKPAVAPIPNHRLLLEINQDDEMTNANNNTTTVEECACSCDLKIDYGPNEEDVKGRAMKSLDHDLVDVLGDASLCVPQHQTLGMIQDGLGVCDDSCL